MSGHISNLEVQADAYMQSEEAKGSERFVAQQNSLSFHVFVENVTQVLLPEFLASANIRETVDALKALNCPGYHETFVVKAIRTVLDHSLEKQRCMSELLTILYDTKIVNRAQFSRAFEKLIYQSHDIQLDVPDVFGKLYVFLRCAIEDNIVSPNFTMRLPESFLIALIEALENDTECCEEEIERLNGLLQVLQDYKRKVKDFVVNEFFTVDEVRLFLKMAGDSEHHHELVRELVKAAMGRTNLDCERTSSCFSTAFGRGPSQFNANNILIGFTRLIEEIDEIKIDILDSRNLLAKFIVRAIADEILPHMFLLDSIRLGYGGYEGLEVMKMAKKWISESNEKCLGILHFQKIWLVGDADGVEMWKFKKQIQEVLTDHFDDLNVSATKDALDRLNVTPEQAPIFIKKALDLSIEKSEREQEAVITLFQYLLSLRYIDLETIAEGFRLCQKSLPELICDVPKGSQMFSFLVAKAKDAGLLLEGHIFL